MHLGLAGGWEEKLVPRSNTLLVLHHSYTVNWFEKNWFEKKTTTTTTHIHTQTHTPTPPHHTHTPTFLIPQHTHRGHCLEEKTSNLAYMNPKAIKQGEKRGNFY